MSNGLKISYILQKHFETKKLYDGLPYSVHLSDAVMVAERYKHLLPDEVVYDVIIAVWGHDLIEDTGESFNDVKKNLGEFSAELIYRVTNEKGKTRKERANDKYYIGIAESDLATFVKLCDRISNTNYSRKTGNTKKLDMYRKEYPKFKEYLFNNKYIEMWEELENDEIKKETMTYENITKFDKDTIHQIHLPKPIPYELYHELFDKGVIRKKDLELNEYYYGKCRNAFVAVWNGTNFVYMRSKFGQKFPENINHLEDDNGFDLFIPIEKIIPTEEQKVSY